MRKRYLLLLLPLLLLALAGTCYGWQGRMGGMGDPYGLVADESDFLIHPAKIARGEGIKFYGDYRFTYNGVTDWDYEFSRFSLAGVWSRTYWDNVSGDEYRHNALLGAAFPLGPGRMGLFFTYDGMRGDYDGDYASTGGSFERLELMSTLDNFALRLLYGMPLGGFKLGGEVQFAYRQEKKETKSYTATSTWVNEYWYWINVYMWPYESSYWEALLKGSIEGKVGPLDLEFTVRGGFDFASDNEWDENGTPVYRNDLTGGVQGWKIGGDLWARYPLGNGLTLPFLVRVDYQEKTRDGDGLGWGMSAGNSFDYEHEERDLAITVGGGVDKELDAETRVAASIYYNYLQRTENLSLNASYPGGWEMDDNTYPDSIEHRVLLRMAGERAFSPTVSLRAGLSFFYGWMVPSMKFFSTYSIGGFDMTESSGHGTHWGVGASLGGTIKFKPITVEPFVSGGYQQLHQKGDGEASDETGPQYLIDVRLSRSEWNIGGGFSVLFDLP
jgi:hypothetical protein